MSEGQLRILWVNDRASFYGGCERYVAAMASRFREAGHVNHLHFDAQHPSDEAFTSSFEEAQGGGEIDAQIRAFAPDLIYLHKVDDRALVEKVLDTATCPVVMFIHDHDHFCLRYHKITTVKKEVCRRPASAWNCYRCLGFINRVHGESPGVKFRFMPTLKSLQAMVRRCDHVVVGSHYMRGHVLAHRFDPDRVHRIPLFADCEPAPPSSDVLKKDQFLFVGNFFPGKGIDLLLDAFAKAETSLQLCIIGSLGDASLYEDQAKQLGIAERVVFKRDLSRAEILREMRESLAVVVPSRNPETFGLVGVEAISQSTPVIASDAGATAEWIEEEVNGYQFPSDDVDGLARCLEKMAASPLKATQMGEQGFLLYEQSFKPEHHLNALLGLFHQTIAEKAEPLSTSHA